MNKDQIKGAAKEMGGEVQEQAGKLTGNAGTEARGHAKEMEGKLQKKVGDAKEAARDEARDAEKAIERDKRDEL